MKITLRYLYSFLFLLSASILFAQEGIISGTLTDHDRQPLPGASVTIKDTNKSTTTDFDGIYSIYCKAGDILHITYLGFIDKEVHVTPDMFDNSKTSSLVKSEEVKLVESNAFEEAIKKNDSTLLRIPSIADSQYTLSKKERPQLNRIKNINIKNYKIDLNYFKPDIFFEVGLTSKNSFQFIKKSNLPVLQKTCSQGLPNNGMLAHEGPESGTLFSYGPKLSLLAFDGSTYAYDANGRLVDLDNGNSLPAKVYDNYIFNTGINSSYNAYFNIHSDHSSFKFNYNNIRRKDLYDIERNSSNNFVIKFKNKNYHKMVSWEAFLKFGNQDNNQPNINGFQNNLLLNSWVTPPSFDNNQTDRLDNGSQRSFSPNSFNNPNWLLQNNQNSEKQNHFISHLNSRISISDEASIYSNINYSNFKNEQQFALVKNTNGFKNGYLSNRLVDKNNLNTSVNFDFEGAKVDINSKTNFRYEDLNYNLLQAEGFNAFSFENPQNNTSNQKKLFRSTLRLHNKINLKLIQNSLRIALSNNSYISSLQNNKWFLPTLQVKWYLRDVIDIYDFFGIYISSGISRDINEASLLYDNLSHNSLNILPEESLSLRAVNDLFLDNTLILEEQQSFDINFGFSFNALGAYFNFDFAHFRTINKNVVFPILNDNAFQLKNVADLKNHGFEIDLSSRINFSNNFYYYPKLTFSTYRPEVTKLSTASNRLPIAGFSSISQNLIVGQPAGVIVGSAYARNNNNTIIIDNDGFPLVNSEPQIIGNPVPKFNLAWNNEINLHGFTLNFLIDFQRGGNIWNGTQNVLNYFGTSQQSANERNISNFVFNGVNTQEEINTIPVDFYNPNNPISENRFVRYGFEGVAEDAIVDGSYINLKSIDLSYTFRKNSRKSFFRTFKVGLFGNNLFTWAKYKGASPYGSLYDYSSGKGLNFFNAPIISDVGLKLEFKI